MKFNKEIKKVIALLLLCVFTLSFTANVGAAGFKYRTNVFFEQFYKGKDAISYRKPYKSPSFVVSKDAENHISVAYYMFGDRNESYKVYLQKYNEDTGNWTSQYIAGAASELSIDVNPEVEQGARYRIYITYTGGDSNFWISVGELYRNLDY